MSVGHLGDDEAWIAPAWLDYWLGATFNSGYLARAALELLPPRQ